MTSDFEPWDAMTLSPPLRNLGAGYHNLSIGFRGAPYFFNGFGCRSTLI
jgi:hypothetical protein